MRIIYLHQHFCTPAMAAGGYSYEWARRFVRHGHEVHVVAADRSAEGSRWRETLEDGIHIHWYPVAYSNSMRYRRRMGSFFHFAWVAGRKAVSLPGDVVIASSTPLTIALPGAYVARKKSIPMVFEVADLWPEMPIAVGALRSRPAIAAARWLERFAYRHSAHIVAQSPGVKDGVVAAGYPPEQVAVVPTCCDREYFQVSAEAGQEFRRQHDWLGSRPMVLYGGSMGHLNGVDYLARLAAIVGRRDPEICFVVVGTGAEESKVRHEAESLGVLGRNFLMLPPIPRRQMPAVLSAADIATSVFIDLKEMWSNNASKVFDALAAGRPIAINHQGWLADMIRQSNCGLVLDVHDLETSADQVVCAIRDRQWLAQAGAAATRLARERFDRATMADVFESILLRVVGAAPPAAHRRAA